MSLLGIGTLVVIKDIRSGTNDRFAAVVTGADAQSGRHFVTKFNANGTNRAGPALEVIAKAMRFDNGSAPESGEDYAIEKITGLSPEMADSITRICKEFDELKKQYADLRADMIQRDSDSSRGLHAAFQTVVQFFPADVRQMASEAMDKGVVVKPDVAPQAIAPVKEKPTDADGFEPVGAGPVNEPKKRK